MVALRRVGSPTERQLACMAAGLVGDAHGHQTLTSTSTCHSALLPTRATDVTAVTLPVTAPPPPLTRHVTGVTDVTDFEGVKPVR